MCHMRRRIHVCIQYTTVQWLLIYEEEDTCVICGGGYMCAYSTLRCSGCSFMRRIHVSYEEEDTCVHTVHYGAVVVVADL